MNEGTINAEVTMGGAMGVLLVNRYRVLKQLGQGGMGSVWLAEDTKLDGRKVAVKMLPSILVSNKRAYAQVKQEALVSLKLTHSNIVAVRAFEEEGGTPFLVMDYIKGRTLDDYLAEKGKLGEEETVGLLKPVAAALDYAHSQGVVHRDVKPGNVMIDKSGHSYVLDFGIAREVQETMTRVTGKLSSGTLMYMSPEQLHGAAPKTTQDVYSFAAMAYECLTGHPPFSRGQIEYQIEHDTPESLPRQIAICRGVMAGLEKTPEARPATCAAVLEKGARVRSADDGAPARKTRIAVVLLGVLALGALVGGGWWWQERTKNEALTTERARKAEEAKIADEKRITEKKSAEGNRVAEKKRGVEEAKVERERADADKRRQEEVAKLTMARTKIAIKVASAKDDYEKSLSYRTERDGFESHLVEIDRQWETVECVQNPKSLAEAAKTLVAVTEAADAIAFELNWLRTNRDGRDAAKRIKQEIVGELDAKLHDFKANDVAKLKFDKGQDERRSAAAAFARGEFASARRQYETAKATLSAALAEARQFHVKTALAVANEYKAASQWQKCCDEVAKVLAWDAQNAEALELKTEAARHLEPSILFVAKIGDREVPATALFDGKPSKSPWMFEKNVKRGSHIPSSDVAVEYLENNKLYVGIIEKQVIDWENGLKTVVVQMNELTFEHAQDVQQTDKLKAIPILEKLAQMGNANAQCELGKIYRYGDYYKNGKGVTRDKVKGIEYLRQSACNGNSFAMYMMGTAYQYGDGVTKDPSQAIDWYKKAVAAGDKNSSYQLGWVYRDLKQYSTAAYWLREAIKTRVNDRHGAYPAWMMGQMHVKGFIKLDDAEFAECIRLAKIGGKDIYK